MPGTRSNYTATMDQELNFIQGIGGYGTNHFIVSRTPKERAERTIRCLRGYIESLEVRRKWFPGVNIDRLRRQATNRLKRLDGA